MDIMIKKRDGHVEPLSVEKTKRMIAFACLGLDSCDPMELELDSKLQFVDGMTTQEIQKTFLSILLGFGSNCTRPNRSTTTEYTFTACCMAGALLRHT